jgi:hypothetical protein
MDPTISPLRKERHMLIKALAFLVIILVNAGCSYIMPPQKIPMDRRNYVDAVSTSWKEQLLTNLVKLRYGDTLTFLEMTSVTTSYELGGSLAAAYTTPWHFLFGTTGARNTFTGSGAVTYSDRPTISYAPIRGDNLTKTLINPIDPAKILKGLQTGWRPEYILACCVKSINNWQNPQDKKYFILADLAHDLRLKGVIRITIDEAKGPTKYDVTVHMKDKILQEKEPSEPGKEPTRKAATKPKKGKKNVGGTDKQKEENEDSAIGLLVLDKDRIKGKELEDAVKYFKELLWSGASPLGKDLYKFKCSDCHGPNGDGKGPLASTSDPKPANFHDPRFWTGDVDEKIGQAVTQGKDHMEEIDMKPEELKGVTSYIRQEFGRYLVYKIIDGNQQPRPLDPYCDKIVVKTRSILQVFTYLAEFIQVPDEHIAQKRARRSKLYGKSLNGPVDEEDRIMFNIKSSKGCPRDSFVAVQKNDYWFYIDDKEFASKVVFSGIAGILSLTEPGTKEGTPVLTLPVQ